MRSASKEVECDSLHRQTQAAHGRRHSVVVGQGIEQFGVSLEAQSKSFVVHAGKCSCR